MTNFGFIHTVYFYCLWPTFNLIGSAFWLPPLSMHCFSRLLACQLDFLLDYLTWKVLAVACPMTSLPSTKVCYSSLSPSRFRQRAFALMPASRFWLAPLASVYRCFQLLPQISVCKIPVHRDWPALRPTLWGPMVHYLLDCSRYWVQAFPMLVFTHTSAEFWLLPSSFFDALPN